MSESYNWRDHWQDKYRDGTPVECVVPLPMSDIKGAVFMSRAGGYWGYLHRIDGKRAATDDDHLDLLPLPKPKVLRPYRDLEEFAAAVKVQVDEHIGHGIPPGMCIRFVWWRENNNDRWHPMDSLIIDFPYRFHNKKEWTIDPTSPVGRPFGVEE